MSLFSYNNVQLPLPNMLRFDRTAVYEESGTDWFVTRFDIHLSCILNVAYLEVVTTINGNPLTNPAQIMNTLWTLLMTPRKLLSYKVQGVEMIPSVQEGRTDSVDAINGPQPQYCRIRELSPTTFILEYAIVAHYWENNPSDGTTTNRPGNTILFNRWSDQIIMDEFMRSTRIRSGTLRIRSDNIAGLVPDDLRSQMAVVSIPFNFRRVQSRYTVTPDGLTLQYQTVDQEVFKQPPNPAFKAEGYFMELASQAGAVFRECIVNIKLYGSPSTDQAALYAAAWTILTGKIALNKGAENGGNQWNNAVIGGNQGNVNNGKALSDPIYTEIKRIIHMWDNIVEIEARAIVNFVRNRIANAPIDVGPMVFTPGSDDQPKVPPPYLDRGSANILLRAAAYWDPNAVNSTNLIPAQDTSLVNPFTSVSTGNFIPPLGGVVATAPRSILPGNMPGTVS